MTFPNQFGKTCWIPFFSARLAFQMSVSNTLPLLPKLEDGQTSPTMRRSLSSSFKTMSMRMERVESRLAPGSPEACCESGTVYR